MKIVLLEIERDPDKEGGSDTKVLKPRGRGGSSFKIYDIVRDYKSLRVSNRSPEVNYFW